MREASEWESRECTHYLPTREGGTECLSREFSHFQARSGLIHTCCTRESNDSLTLTHQVCVLENYKILENSVSWFSLGFHSSTVFSKSWKQKKEEKWERAKEFLDISVRSRAVVSLKVSHNLKRIKTKRIVQVNRVKVLRWNKRKK